MIIYTGKILDAASALNALSTILGRRITTRASDITIDIEWGVGVTAGEVVVETAHPDFAGTWSVIQTYSFAGDNRNDHFEGEGLHNALRVRVSDAIVGGTVTAHAIARC